MQGLDRKAQFILLLLAFLPLWYILLQHYEGNSAAEPSPYYMECAECRLKYWCGPEGIRGMRCPGCKADVMLFRTRVATPGWDFLVKLLVGIIAFAAVIVLVVGGEKRPKRSKKTAAPEPEIDAIHSNSFNEQTGRYEI